MTSAWFSELSEALAQPGKRAEEATPSIWARLASEADINTYRPHPDPMVIAREIEDTTGNYFVLKNTESKTYLRLSSEEYRLWQLMDGEKTIRDLVVEHFAVSGAFSHNLIIQLVHQLRANNMLLEKPEYVWGNVKRELQKRGWAYKLSTPARVILTQQLEIPGIDRFITGLQRAVGWVFFTKPVQWIMILIALAGFVFFNLVLINPDYVLIQQIGISEVALFWLAAILPILIHEMGHALTVKHYGREVNAGGLMLYFGLPAAYVDTTDIWLENRRARLNVTWNGPFTGLILGGACAIFMWLNPRYEFNSFLFKMASVCYLTVFININPFLKYDGYYMLSDALRITFLRERSIEFIRKSWLGKLARRERFTRDERIFSIFGVLSILWTGYALYLATVFWNARVRSGLQILLGSNYDLLTKALSVLSTAAFISLLALIILQFVRAISSLVSGYVRHGGLQRHAQLAQIGVILPALLAFGFSRISAPYQDWLLLLLGSGVPIATGLRLFMFNRSYYLSQRWWAQLVLSIMLLALGLVPLASYFLHTDLAFETYLIGAAAGLSIVGGILFILPALPQIKPLQILVGLLGAVILAAVAFELGILNGIMLLIPLVAWTAIMDGFGLRGGGRMPALLLIHFGIMVTATSFVLNPSSETFWLFGILLTCAGVCHLVLARLPNLSKTDFPISSNKKDAIGFSVAILVRRVISQVFFESGWSGILTFANSFSQQMQTLGISLSIAGNQFHDGELAVRQTFDLTEVYGYAFDKIYELLKGRFGDGYARLTIGHGIDLIPWQYREVIGELVLARREWGLTLNQETMDQRSRRIKLLDRVPLFIDATYDDLRPIAAMLKSRQYASGETIIRQGEPGHEFFIIENGKVQVWQQEENMESIRVNSLGPGQFFGEVALVTDAPRNATIIAETPATLLSLGREDFDTLVKQHLTFAQTIKADIRSKWVLRNMPIFDELGAIELNYLASLLKTEIFKSGEFVIRQGDVADKFYIVESGELRIFRKADGGTMELDHHSPGDYFGEIALLNKSPRTASVVALTDVELLSLESDAFMNMLGDFTRMRQALEKTGSRRLHYHAIEKDVQP